MSRQNERTDEMTFTAYEIEKLMNLDEIRVQNIETELHSPCKVELYVLPYNTTDFTNIMRLLNVLIKKKKNEKEIDKLLKLILGECDD